MPSIYRVVELIIEALHVVGGLSGAVAHLVGGDAEGAIHIALTAAECMLILAGAWATVEVGMLLVRLLVRWCERRYLSAPRDKEGGTP